MRAIQCCGTICMLLLSTSLIHGEANESPRRSTVGMPARIDQLILPGSELEAKPVKDARSPVIVRIINVFPHGTAHRYDLEYYGLEPGTFDLKDYLQRKDGSLMDGVPSIPVVVEALLPPGQIEPHSLEAKSAPILGGYRLLLMAAGCLWLVGLLAILLVGRRKKATAAAAEGKPISLAERLRPLVENAMTGKSSHAEQAELERLLLAFWRRRLHLEKMKPAEAMAVLRSHEEAGKLVKQLETWLHQPEHANEVDVATLLRPYQDLPAESLEVDAPCQS